MKRVPIWLVVIAFGASVLGCVTTQPGVYAYPQHVKTAQHFARDQNECQVWAQYQPGF